jgi:hypothetical protein
MGEYIKILVLIVAGIILLWFCYSLLLGPKSLFHSGWFPWKKLKKKKKTDYKGKPGDPQVCPICSMKLEKGELVKSLAFPPKTGGKDRLMYIRGCFTCLERSVPRRCPVCGLELSLEDYLVSRMFERANNRNHVHVLGCNHCKNMGTLIR